MWLKSHHWVAEPYFRTERKRVLDTVRESKHTVMLFDKKYYDVDSGKYITDKLHTLSSTSLRDIESDYGATCHEAPRSKRGYRNEAWFTPKDDDFDEECMLDEERERSSRISQSVPKREHREPELVKEVEVTIFQPHVMEIKRDLELERLERERQEVIERIRRAEREYQDMLRARVQASAPQPGRPVCNVRPNNWRPK